jgi:uncharacterized SAM-binding protein YcdF (DUF218 family)
MRTILPALITPLALFFELVVFAFIFRQYGRKKTAFVLFVLAFVWLYLISTPIVSKYPIKHLENKFQALLKIPDSLLQKKTHILVLGAGYTSDTTLLHKDQLNHLALGRLIEGIRLQKAIAGSTLILSGWGSDQKRSQAEIMYFSALELGVPDSIMTIIPEPWNTKNEAIEYKKRFGSEYNLVVVTDAIHMPRSMYHFKKQGINPIPAPTNFMVKKGAGKTFRQFIPSGGTLSNVERTMHEYVGLLWAYAGGN